MRGFIRGGMRGFIWGGVVLFGEGVCVVLFGGACVVLFRGVHGFIWGACVVLFGGMCGFIRGACVVLFSGGVCGFSGGGMCGFFGYNEIRSMSGRYASYWNAFCRGIVMPRSLIFMSTHKATAARCLRYHQATYGQPLSAWPL